jgi:uncharacterized coiled-coil protein SlyX
MPPRAKPRRKLGAVFSVITALGFAIAALCLVFGTAQVGRTLKQDHETIVAQGKTIRALRDTVGELQKVRESLVNENRSLRDLLRKSPKTTKPTPQAVTPPPPKPYDPRPPEPKPPRTREDTQGLGPIKKLTGDKPPPKETLPPTKLKFNYRR